MAQVFETEFEFWHMVDTGANDALEMLIRDATAPGTGNNGDTLHLSLRFRSPESVRDIKTRCRTSGELGSTIRGPITNGCVAKPIRRHLGFS